MDPRILQILEEYQGDKQYLTRLRQLILEEEYQAHKQKYHDTLKQMETFRPWTMEKMHTVTDNELWLIGDVFQELITAMEDKNIIPTPEQFQPVINRLRDMRLFHGSPSCVIIKHYCSVKIYI